MSKARMGYPGSRVAGLVVWGGLLLAGSAQAGIELPEMVTAGQPTTVVVTSADGTPLAGMEVKVLYRPGSQVSSSQTVGVTDAAGNIAWSPEHAGLVTLSGTSPDGTVLSSNFAIRFAGVPVSGVLIMLGAGILLYGGALRGFLDLSSLPADLPPDT